LLPSFTPRGMVYLPLAERVQILDRPNPKRSAAWMRGELGGANRGRLVSDGAAEIVG